MQAHDGIKLFELDACKDPGREDPGAIKWEQKSGLVKAFGIV